MVDRLTFRAYIIEASTEKYRLRATRPTKARGKTA